jgi:hypothetical protein
VKPQINPQQPITDSTGKINSVWFQWLATLFGTGQKVAAVAGASPFSYTAPSNGRLIVQGGAVSAVELNTSGARYNTGVTAGIFPLAAGDEIIVTYTAAPNMTFIPG